jgi:hypothetical protein
MSEQKMGTCTYCGKELKDRDVYVNVILNEEAYYAHYDCIRQIESEQQKKSVKRIVKISISLGILVFFGTILLIIHNRGWVMLFGRLMDSSYNNLFVIYELLALTSIVLLRKKIFY